MSGRKDISVSPSEYFDLRNNNRQLRELNSALPGMLREVEAAFSSRLRAQQDWQDRENQALDQSMMNLGDQVKRHEENFKKAMNKQSNTFKQSMQSISAALSQDINELNRKTQSNIQTMRENFFDDLNALNADLQGRLGSLSRKMSDEFASLRSDIDVAFAQTQSHIAGLDARVGTLEENEGRAIELAQEWLDYCTAQNSILESDIALERFLPRRLLRIQSELLAAQQHLQQGQGQAALSSASTTAQRYNELRADLAVEKQAWELARSSALLTTELLLKDVLNQRRVTAVDTENTVVNGVEVEVDFWSDGTLTTLESTVQKQRDLLEKKDCPLDTQELTLMYTDVLPTQMESLSECIFKARSAILLSQLRYDMAAEICKAFERQGYSIDGADGPLYEDDERGPVIALLKAADDTALAVRIIPDSDNGRNTLEIHSYDAATIGEHMLRRCRDDIGKILRKELGMDFKPGREHTTADPKVRRAFEVARAKTLTA